MNQSKGFSLIEVLVAALIFATGILGVASLQMKSLAMLSNSNSVGIALAASSDMVERMNANPDGVFGGFYDSVSADAEDQPEDPECGNSCSGTQLVRRDLFQVYEQLSDGLPDASFSISNLGNNVFTIQVSWTERVGLTSSTKTHRISFLPYKP